MRAVAAAVVAVAVVALAVPGAVAGQADDGGVTVDRDGDAVTVANGTSQLLTGTADAPAGTRVTVRVRSTGDTQPQFIKSTTGVVRADGTWGVTFDFSRQSPGDAFEVTAVVPATDAETAVSGEVTACDGASCEGTTPAPTPTPIPTATPTPASTGDAGDEGDGLGGVDLTYEGSNVTVAAGERQVIRGTSTLPAGTRVTVRVRSTGDTQPQFIRSAGAVVRADGTWSVALDFSRQSPGDTFEVRVLGPGNEGVVADGVVVACEGDCRDPAPAATPTPSPSPTASPDEAPGDGPRLSESVTRVPRGRTAEVAVAFGDADAVTVSIGSPEAGYRIDAVVRDADGDGETTLLFDTSAAGDGGATLAVPAGDRVAVTSETDLDAPLRADDYDLALHRGTDATGSPVAVGTLVVTETDTVTASPTDDATSSTATAVPSDDRGGLPEWAAVVGAGLAFLLAGAGLAAVLLRR